MAQLRALPNSWWVRVEQQSVRGTPDTLGCVRAQFIGIEFKAEKGKLTALQKHNLDRIHKAGGLAIEARPSNWEKIFMGLMNLAESGDYSAEDGSSFN